MEDVRLDMTSRGLFGLVRPPRTLSKTVQRPPPTHSDNAASRARIKNKISSLTHPSATRDDEPRPVWTSLPITH